jgi:hypothetical protein
MTSMPINTSVWYHIVNVNSNRMVEVPYSSPPESRVRDEVIIRQGDTYDSADSSPWRLWQFVMFRDGSYDIFNRGSGRCMVIQNGWTNAGVPCWQYSPLPLQPQERPQARWIISDAGNGSFYLQNVNSNRYLEIKDAGMAKGDQCQQGADTPPGLYSAQWRLIPTSNGTVPALTLATLDGDKIHSNSGVKSKGILRGTNLYIGCSVLIQKGNAKKTWGGQIVDVHNPGPSDADIYWAFEVVHKSGNPDPDQDDDITVTVTNISQQPSSPPLPADPQPSDVP